MGNQFLTELDNHCYVLVSSEFKNNNIAGKQKGFKCPGKCLIWVKQWYYMHEKINEFTADCFNGLKGFLS